MSDFLIRKSYRGVKLTAGSCFKLYLNRSDIDIWRGGVSKFEALSDLFNFLTSP